METSKFIEILPAEAVDKLTKHSHPHGVELQVVRRMFGTVGRVFPSLAGKMAYRLFTRPRKRAMHKFTDEIMESARISEVLYGKTPLKTYIWGDGSKVVYLVHGWESRGTALRSFVPDLVSNGFRVVAFDGPAHGSSGGRQTNLLHFAGAVKAVIRKFGTPHALITHSFGGATSVFALAHLDNSIEIEKLVLIGVPSSTQKVVRNAIHYMNVPPAAAYHFKQILRSKMKDKPIEFADLEHSLQFVKVKSVLVVHDKLDESVPFDSAEKIFERFPHTNLLVTQGLGHYRLMKDPRVVNKVVRFITR